MKKIVLWTIGLLLITLSYGVVETLTVFTNGLNTLNLTFTGNQTNTLYIDVPLYANVTNVTIELYGFSSNVTNEDFNNSILEYYEFENSLEDSGNTSSTLMEIVGTPSYSIGKVGDYALNCSPQLLVRNLSGANLTSAHTADLWIYTEEYNPSGSRILMISDAGNSVQSEIRQNSTGGIKVFYHGGEGGGAFELYSDNNIALRTWTHIIAATHTDLGGGKYAGLFIDGVLEDTNTNGATLGGTDYNRIDLCAESTGGNAFNGSIDNVLISQLKYNQTYVDYSYNGGQGINFSYPLFDNSNIYIEVGKQDGSYEYSVSSISTPVNGSLNTSKFKEILEQECVCTGCTKGTYNCRTPIHFHSDTAGIMGITLSNFSYEFGVDNCTLYGTQSYDISFKDIDDSSVNVNVSNRVDYFGNPSSLYNYSFISPSINNFKLCISPDYANLYGDFDFQYRYSNSVFNYYSNDSLLDNVSNSITLYVDTGDEVTITVYDNINDKVEGAYIHVQRYDPSTGNYLLVGQVVTNFEGQAKLYLTLNTVYYRFLVYYPITTLRKTTSPTYIYSNTIELTIDTYDPIGDDYFNSMDVDYTLDFNNDTNNFRFIYSDTSSNIDGACLKVWKVDAWNNILNDISCLYTTSGTILSEVTPVNDTTYIAKAYLLYGTDEFFLDSVTKRFFSPDITSVMGLLGVFLLTIVFAFLIKFSIPLGIVMIPIPTIMASVIGLIQLDPMIAIGLEIGAIVLAVFVNDRG